METKKEFKDRLKREGRWNEFIQCREKLKAEGISDKEAWSQARQEYGPETFGRAMDESDNDNYSDSSGIDSIDVDIFQGRSKAGARHIVQWVFDHIDVADITPESAPSAGAWSFLQRVRQHPDLLKEFYRTIWAKMLPSRSEIEAKEKFEDDGRSQIHLIDQIRQARDNANE